MWSKDDMARINSHINNKEERVTKTITLTIAEATELMERAVTEKGPDYLYTIPEGIGSCSYFDTKGRPSCIVGHVLSYKGLGADDLICPVLYPYGEAYLANYNTGSSVTKLYLEGILDAPYEVIDALSAAQGFQDTGKTWGEALAAFKDSLARAAAFQ